MRADNALIFGFYETNPLTKDCNGCRYMVPLFGGSPFLVCGYMLTTGVKRGCRPGKHCKRRAESKQK